MMLLNCAKSYMAKKTAVENKSREKCIRIYFDHNFLQQMAHSKPYKKPSIYISLSGCLLFGDKQKFQHFLKNFGNEFLINIYLDEELLNYEDKNPLD